MSDATLARVLADGGWRHTGLDLTGVTDKPAFMDRCAAQGVGVLIGGPFNSGLLAGQARYNYGSVPHDMQERARALAETCAEFRVPLEAAALRFPLAHPAAVSVLAGMRSPQQVLANANWMRRPLPDELWTALRNRGLVHAEAPLPAA